MVFGVHLHEAELITVGEGSREEKVDDLQFVATLDENKNSTNQPGRCFLLAMLLGVWIGWGGGASLYGVAVKAGENGWEASAFAVALGYVISHSILLVSNHSHYLSFPFLSSTLP